MVEIGNWVKILILPLTSLVTLGDIVGLLWGPISQSLYLAHFVTRINKCLQQYLPEVSQAQCSPFGRVSVS